MIIFAKKLPYRLLAPLVLSTAAILSLTGRALAANPPKPMDALKSAAGQAGFSTASEPSLPAMIGNIIGYALALLGVVFTILIIYAGYLWMTAQGNEEQITKAKKMITNAVIGIIVISLAYAISSFVITQVEEAGKATSTPAPPSP